MIPRCIFAFFLLCLVTPFSVAQADFLVLVHGYLGDPLSWERSGVVQTLHQRGWQRGGIVYSSPFGIQLAVSGPIPTEKPIYLASLPSEAPIPVQATHLRLQLAFLARRHPDETLLLVGHSAGGVVARLVLVQNGASSARALITIASPHLGTSRAIQGLEATNRSFPFSILSSFFGGSRYHTLKRSRGLFYDLLPPQPGNFLFWLNGQAHPNIHYHSVIRGLKDGVQGDELVPGISQDMNRVTTLRGHSVRSFYPTSHTLNPGDGVHLADILEGIPN